MTSVIVFESSEKVLDKSKTFRYFQKMLVKKRIIMEMFSVSVGSSVQSTLIVYQEFPISCLIPSVTTELIAAISSFGISGLVYVAIRGIASMIARTRWSFSTV